MSHLADDAIRALAERVVQVTVDHICECYPSPRNGLLRKEAAEMGREIADLVLEFADESAESPVHALRALVDGERTTRPVGWGTE